MGWFGSSTPQKPPGRTDTDVLENLDPSLRNLLDSETPSSISGSQSSTTTSSSQPRNPPPPTTTTDQPPHTHHSSYGDRYAHLWSTYQPPASEDLGKSEQEKLTDVLRAFKKRKTATGHAAQENCVAYQIRLMECYKNGGVTRGWGVKGCAREAREFDGCYTANMKFLQALGYMSDPSRAAEVDEQIQMHADRLYQEQVEQDRLAAERGEERRRGGDGNGKEKDGEDGGARGWWARLTGTDKESSLPDRTRIGNVEMVFERGKGEGVEGGAEGK